MQLVTSNPHKLQVLMLRTLSISQEKIESVLTCTPTHPPVGGLGGYMLKMSAPTPTPPELKNVTKIFYTIFLTKFLNKV